MYFPGQSQLVVDETQNFNIINKKVKSDYKMDKPSLYQFGFFCLTWKESGQNHSIWSFGNKTLIKLFFKLDKNQELLYFPPGDEMIKIFRRGR